jgi:selenocysteine-specific elongation factor
VRVAEHFVNEGRLVNRGGYFAAVGHQPSLSREQRAFFDDLFPIAQAQPLLPIPFAGAATAARTSRIAGLSKAFDTMLARGVFVKIGDDLYRGSQVATIRERVEAHFRRHERMTAAEFRDILGTSRKYAVPLLEWLDVHGVTIRNGDFRTLRKQEIRQ